MGVLFVLGGKRVEFWGRYREEGRDEGGKRDFYLFLYVF